MLIKPPNVLVLDLDETIGSFGIAYSILNYLQLNKITDLHEFIVGITPILESTGVFRPYLKMFLTCIVKLKELHLIDFVFVYTNQGGISDYSTACSSMTPFLVCCMEELVGQRFIDRVYTRDSTIVKKPNEIPQKDFQRIFNDITYSDGSDIPGFTPETFLFIDDYPQNIFWMGISMRGSEYENAVCKIKPYSKRFESIKDIYPLLDVLIETIDFTILNTELYEIIWNQYLTRRPEICSQENDIELLKMIHNIVEKFETNSERQVSKQYINSFALLREGPFSYSDESCREYCKYKTKG